MEKVVFNQNAFQLILQLRCCSLALAHERWHCSVRHVIYVMMTDWCSWGTVSALWQQSSPQQHHLMGVTSPDPIQCSCQRYKSLRHLTTATAHLFGCTWKGNDTEAAHSFYYQLNKDIWKRKRKKKITRTQLFNRIAHGVHGCEYCTVNCFTDNQLPADEGTCT